MKINIIKPSYDGHVGDTFRELLDLWEENQLCNITYQNTPYVWWGGVGENILYDRPILDKYPPNIPFKKIIFGNTIPKNAQPWIFWARRPRLLHQFLDNKPSLPYTERSITSIFLGKVENSVQYQYRPDTWSKYIDVFEMPIRGAYKYSQSEYLNQIHQSKFGLSLRGYGPKCNREIELLALGTVPILAPEVDVQYYEPLQEGIHFLRVSSPQEIPSLIESITQDQWEYMSQQGREWYNRNCSTINSFYITKEILEDSK